jgi:ribosomal protein L19E
MEVDEDSNTDEVQEDVTQTQNPKKGKKLIKSDAIVDVPLEAKDEESHGDIEMDDKDEGKGKGRGRGRGGRTAKGDRKAIVASRSSSRLNQTSTLTISKCHFPILFNLY